MRRLAVIAGAAVLFFVSPILVAAAPMWARLAWVAAVAATVLVVATRRLLGCWPSRGVVAAAMLVTGIAGAAGAGALSAGAAGPSAADVRYAAAVSAAGYDPADPHWAQYAHDTCADLRAGGGPSHIADTNLGYVYGAAVGAYCLDMSSRAWYSR